MSMIGMVVGLVILMTLVVVALWLIPPAYQSTVKHYQTLHNETVTNCADKAFFVANYQTCLDAGIREVPR